MAKSKPWNAYDFKDKQGNIERYMRDMYIRTTSMFEWQGLPDSIPAKYLELYLQTYGFAGITKVDKRLYAFFGGLGGEPDVYYRPTILTVANPALNYSATLKIGEECVIIKSDVLYNGLSGINRRYATAMVENDLSMNRASINSRLINTISAGDDRTAKSAVSYLQAVENGDIGVIAEQAFLDGVKIHPTQDKQKNVTDLIELHQYYKASWYNELGLNANYNMKRESIMADEAQLNESALYPLIDDMLFCRQQGADEVNKMYGTNISVKLSSSWERQREVNVSSESERILPELED